MNNPVGEKLTYTGTFTWTEPVSHVVEPNTTFNVSYNASALDIYTSKEVGRILGAQIAKQVDADVMQMLMCEYDALMDTVEAEKETKRADYARAMRVVKG
jgi:hypothetical protein